MALGECLLRISKSRDSTSTRGYRAMDCLPPSWTRVHVLLLSSQNSYDSTRIDRGVSHHRTRRAFLSYSPLTHLIQEIRHIEHQPCRYRPPFPVCTFAGYHRLLGAVHDHVPPALRYYPRLSHSPISSFARMRGSKYLLRLRLNVNAGPAAGIDY